MADVNGLLPFVGGQAPAQPNPVQNEWAVALQDPAVRSSLIQFGLGMMSPMAQGQTPLGHVAQSIGGVGEMFTRQEDQDLKRDKVDYDQDYRAKTLEQGERRTRATEMNAATRRQSANQRATGGGLSAKDILKQQLSEQKELRARADRLAKAYEDEIRNATYGGDLSPDAARFKGKSRAEISSELLKDQKWRDQQLQESRKIIESTIPPAPQRVVGRVYQTPKGPLVWQGTGWAHPTPTASASSTADDEDDE
jgi:hypothetical protein